jgi:hypothetical protein
LPSACGFKNRHIRNIEILNRKSINYNLTENFPQTLLHNHLFLVSDRLP